MIDFDEIFSVDDRYKAFQEHKSGVLVSIAGPGTGKTFSLLRRIESLVSDKFITPSSIAYITFIREISKTFINDYEEEFKCSINDPDQPRISTLHSYACRLIRNEGFNIGYDGELYFTSIASDKSNEFDIFCEDLIPYVSELSLTTKSKIRKKLKIVKSIWQNDGDPGKIDEPIPTLLNIALQLARSYRLVDWDQAIPLAYSLYDLAREHPKWISHLRHFLIDEYQDFNTSEQKFIMRIARNVDLMVIVGDDCQSIYKSRGGSPKGIIDLFYSGDFNKVTLQRNRRNYSKILNYINTLLLLIRRNASPMLPYHDGGEISCYKFKSSKSEIEFLIDYLKNRISELPAEPKSKEGIVCLFPTKKVRDFYFDALRDHIPCYIQDSQYTEEREWVSILMQLYCRPYQRFIERLILNSITTIKPRHKKTIVRTILDNDTSPTDAVKSKS